MRAATQDFLPRSLGGPMASVLVALAGAALVVAGLFLLGVHQAKAGNWNPVVSSISIAPAG